MRSQRDYTNTVDEFTGNRISMSDDLCTWYPGEADICTRFYFVEGRSFLTITYEANDWVFAETLLLKNRSSGEIYSYEGNYNTWTREVGNGGFVLEQMAVEIDQELFNFIKSCLGSEVVARFIGKDKIIDIELDKIGNDPDLHQWAAFVEKYESINL